MLAEALTQRLRDRFPDVKMVFGTPPEAVVVIPAVHPDVGNIQIFDDVFEATLVAGNFTHGHFSSFKAKSQEEAEQQIVEDVTDFLERLFADQIVLWGSQKSSGGWYDRERASAATSEHQRLTEGTKRYVWSGPLNR